MFIPTESRSPYFVGVVVSLVGHVVGAFFALHLMEVARSRFEVRQEIFSVTLEGGEKLGGISQVPTDDQKSKKPLPKTAEPVNEEVEEVKASNDVDAKAAAVEEEKVKKAEEAKRVADEKKALKLAEEKKLAEQKRLDEKKKAEEEKKKEEADKKKQAADAKLAKEQEAKDKKSRDQQLLKAIQRAENRYRGESANAGGEGFGAARLGGQGMGGGTLASLEFIAYRNRLEQLFKQQWKWLPGASRFVSQVEVSILPDGTVQRAVVVGNSGNSTFDDSAVRAVLRASPVPPPPQELYEKFRVVRITFDSEER